MGNDVAMQLFSSLLLNTLLICAPLLIVTLIAGLLVSIFQAVTQIQDMSLSFIPKAIVAAIGLAVFGPWMLRRLLGFATELIGSIPHHF